MTSDEHPGAVARELRQRLEALKRAGVDRLPIPLPEIQGRNPASRPATAATTTTRPPDAMPGKPKPAAPVTPKPAPPAAPAALFGGDALEGESLPLEARREALTVLAATVAACVRCPELAATRTQTVFGAGDPKARLMFIGEAPGADEDRRGEPFVGRAGQLLTDMITKGMGLRREDVFIANILKCRPPGNRDPSPAEAANCIGYLEQQIAIVRPDYLCLLGLVAARRLLDTALPMNRLRGRWHRVKGVNTIVTYHPAALLRNPAWKKDTWEDLKTLMRAMGLKLPDARKPADE